MPGDSGYRGFFRTVSAIAGAMQGKQPADQQPLAVVLADLVEKTSFVETALQKLNLRNGADALTLATDRLRLAGDALENVSREIEAAAKGDVSGYIALFATALKYKAQSAGDPCEVGIPSDDQTKTALGLFQLILRANPKLTTQFGKLLGGTGGDQSTPEYVAAMNQIGTIVNQGLGQVLAARVRIQQYIGDLTQVQVDLGTENARHTQTLLTLGQFEAARWQLIGELLDQYSLIYDPKVWLGETDVMRENWAYPAFDDPMREQRLRQHPMAQTIRIRLFADDYSTYTAERDEFGPANDIFRKQEKDAVKQTEILGKANAGGAAPPALQKFNEDRPLLLVHPFVSRDDGVIASIRKLADTLRAYHYDSQAAQDPMGWNLTRANIRLQKAISLVDGTLLLLSGNEHSASENGVRLNSEMMLHSVRLDSFERRTYEAGYRLALGDIKAFHASGITDEDLKAIESAALVAIGIRVK